MGCLLSVAWEMGPHCATLCYSAVLLCLQKQTGQSCCFITAKSVEVSQVTAISTSSDDNSQCIDYRLSWTFQKYCYTYVELSNNHTHRKLHCTLKQHYKVEHISTGFTYIMFKTEFTSKSIPELLKVIHLCFESISIWNVYNTVMNYHDNMMISRHYFHVPITLALASTFSMVALQD